MFATHAPLLVTVELGLPAILPPSLSLVRSSVEGQEPRTQPSKLESATRDLQIGLGPGLVDVTLQLARTEIQGKTGNSR